MDDTHGAETAIERGDRRIREALESLPPEDTSQFWDAIYSRQTPPEVLVHHIHHFHVCGRRDDANRVTATLVDRTYATAKSIVAGRMEYLPQLHEDAIQETYALMWHDIALGKALWERNFWWIFRRKCWEACGKFLPPKQEGSISWNEHPPAPERVPPQDEWGNGPGRVIYGEALARLSHDERQVWSLFFDEDLPQKEIAARLGCTDKTVYNRLRAARQKLAAFFAGGRSDDE